MTYTNKGNTVINTSENGFFRNVYFSEYAGTKGFQGDNFGYASGGSIPAPTGPPTQLNIIERFPFAVITTNVTDVGDLTLARFLGSGTSSFTRGYTGGGGYPYVQGTSYGLDNIDAFPFATSVTNATNVGVLTQARHAIASQSSSTHGYSSGGFLNTDPYFNIIDRFPFATDTNATDVGDLPENRLGVAGQSSTTNGYAAGGFNNPPPVSLNTVRKFPFASPTTNTTAVGTLTVARQHAAGLSSITHGYTAGGFTPTPASFNVIDRYPFASDVNSTDVGDLTVARSSCSGQSAVEHGYTTGGATGNVIDRFPFAASTTNATDVGDLSGARNGTVGQQY